MPNTKAQKFSDRATAMIVANAIGLIYAQNGTHEDAIKVILSLIHEIRNREKVGRRDV